MTEQASGQGSATTTPGAASRPSIITAAGGLAHGASSIAKASVLRRDRVSDADYQARLEVCQNCPGGHATFKADGSLHTCGPMVQSLKDAGRKTCGCLLSRKARDAKESCPFGYWPTIEATAIEQDAEPVSASADSEAKPRRHRGGCGCGCGKKRKQQQAHPQSGLSRLWWPGKERPRRVIDPNTPGTTRRGFLGRSAAAMGMMLVGPRVWATGSNLYVPIEACDQGSGTHAECSEVAGREEGEAFTADEDGYQYRITSVTPVQNPVNPTIRTPDGNWQSGCLTCDDPCACGDCCFGRQSTVSLTKPTVTSSAPDGSLPKLAVSAFNSTATSVMPYLNCNGTTAVWSVTSESFVASDEETYRVAIFVTRNCSGDSWSYSSIIEHLNAGNWGQVTGLTAGHSYSADTCCSFSSGTDEASGLFGPSGSNQTSVTGSSSGSVENNKCCKSGLTCIEGTDDNCNGTCDEDEV